MSPPSTSNTPSLRAPRHLVVRSQASSQCTCITSTNKRIISATLVRTPPTRQTTSHHVPRPIVRLELSLSSCREVVRSRLCIPWILRLPDVLPSLSITQVKARNVA